MQRVGQGVGRWVLVQLGALLLLAVHPRAASAVPKVVVVVDPQAETSVSKQAQSVEQALHDQVALVPLADYLRAAKALGAGPRASYGSEMAVGAGRAVGATHVLFFGQVTLHQPGRRRDSVQIATTLVDTVTGENAFEQRNARERERNLPALGQRLAGLIVAAAAPGAEPAGAAVAVVAAPATTQAGSNSAEATAAAPAAPAPTAAPSVAPPATGTNARRDDNKRAAVVPPPVAESTPAPAPAPLPPPAPEVAPAPQAVAVAEPSAVPPADAQAALQPPAAPRPGYTPPYGVRMQLGTLLYQRIGLVSEGNTPVLRYGGGAGRKAPLFARINLRLQLQPSRWVPHPQRWWDGLTLFADADLGWARTATGQSAATRNNGSWQVGGGWRQALWQGPRATVLTLQLAYSRYSFAVPRGANFVGTGFAGLLTELGAEIPLGLSQLLLVGQAGVIAPLHTFGGAQRLGDTIAKSLGGRAEVGLRVVAFGHMDIDLAFNWQRYRIVATGESQVSEFPRSYTGAKLADQSLGGSLRLGAHF